jgi:hypothetical protein
VLWRKTLKVLFDIISEPEDGMILILALFKPPSSLFATAPHPPKTRTHVNLIRDVIIMEKQIYNNSWKI